MANEIAIHRVVWGFILIVTAAILLCTIADVFGATYIKPVPIVRTK